MSRVIEAVRHTGQNVRLTVHEFWNDDQSYASHLPTLQIRELPLTERWEAAESLNSWEQREFIRQEVLSLIDNVDVRGGHRTNHRRFLSMDELNGSELPVEIREYVATPLVNGTLRETWKSPEIQLRTSAFFWTGLRAAEARITLMVGEAVAPGMYDGVDNGGRNIMEGLGITVASEVFLFPKDKRETDVGSPKVALRKNTAYYYGDWGRWTYTSEYTPPSPYRPLGLELESKYAAAEEIMEATPRFEIARQLVALGNQIAHRRHS